MSKEATSAGIQPTEYILEHLTNLNSLGQAQTSIVDFSIMNYDTIFWSLTMGLLSVGLLVLAARRVTSGV
ncbi:MAG: F0F1 ATP synthase subunit A, partial [Burkholderiales bacterium]|nr:F0F1 ATP synthase subunit A [Burkholderiales bacterium]